MNFIALFTLVPIFLIVRSDIDYGMCPQHFHTDHVNPEVIDGRWFVVKRPKVATKQTNATKCSFIEFSAQKKSTG